MDLGWSPGPGMACLLVPAQMRYAWRSHAGRLSRRVTHEDVIVVPDARSMAGEAGLMLRFVSRCPVHEPIEALAAGRGISPCMLDQDQNRRARGRKRGWRKLVRPQVLPRSRSCRRARCAVRPAARFPEPAQPVPRAGSPTELWRRRSAALRRRCILRRPPAQRYHPSVLHTASRQTSTMIRVLVGSSSAMRARYPNVTLNRERPGVAASMASQCSP